MKMKVLLPTKVLVEEDVRKITAEAQNGAFCLLPKHIDFVAALVPGLLSFETEQGKEVFLAVDEGTLVKCGDETLVSVRNAVRGTDLGKLRQTVREQFDVLDEHEKRARSASAKIEAGFVRRFLELHGHGR
jgi:F-type H+-transporting ATPase subunit epsilon